MKSQNLKDEMALQSYFVNKISDYIRNKGKNVIGWDEIMEGGLAPHAFVMSWRGEEGGIEAANMDHDVVMTPGKPLYFDYSQSANEDSLTIGGLNTIADVYDYDPVPKSLSPEKTKHIIGAQANMWTEIGRAHV